MAANVFTIAAGLPFAETLARGVIERLDARSDPLALANVTIYLPTRRAARTLGDTFAKIMGGAALLPNLQPLGDLDDEDIVFDPAQENLDLPPAIQPLRRRLLLATLVARWQRAKRAPSSDFAQAVSFARALGQFLDEALTQEADLSQLEDLAPAALAEHWADVRDFLVLLRDAWPQLLAAEAAIEPVARRSALLDARAAQYRETGARGPVIAAGTTGSIPATARLLAAIAQMPGGAIVLPGLDLALDESSWEALDPGHPQFGLKELLGRLALARADVRLWREPPAALTARTTLLRETLRPAPTTDAWRAIADTDSAAPSDAHVVRATSPASGGGNRRRAKDNFPPPLAREVSAKRTEGAKQNATPTKSTIAEGLNGLSLIEAAHPGEEALAIALILRETLETPRATAALVTPDRNLARRVAAELGRWNIAIDDSAGRPLSATPPGTFLLLLAEALSHGLAPVPLLALLKHPLAAGGMETSAFRRLARAFDRFCLRGPRPDPGFDALKRRAEKCDDAYKSEIADWLTRIERDLAPFCALLERQGATLPDIAAAHAKAAEALAASDTQTGAERLWAGDAGASAAELLASLQEEAVALPEISPISYPALLRVLMEERAVRPAYGRHPRLAILGPLEARLQNFDVVILGGLNEGTWPAQAAADPWLSRPMRERLGFAAPERAIGLAAHDFSMLAAGAKTYLTRSLKTEGTPTVASRWIQRLVQLTSGLGLRRQLESTKDYGALAARLQSPDRYAPESRPAPAPPVVKRPRSLSVTEIETWLRDPYAIYAKHILKLVPLDALDARVGPLERGTAIHRILELFLKENLASSQAEAEARLIAAADKVFDEEAIPLSARALWRPRLVKAARWFVRQESERQADIARSFVEIRGTRDFNGPAGAFRLRARADRIDILKAGGAAIVDYKTGQPPSARQVEELLAPQLPLEGVILAEGGFPDIGPQEARALLYIQFAGGAEAGRLLAIENVPALVKDVEERLLRRIAFFDLGDTPYLSRVIPFREDLAGDYDHLARVREWSLAGAPENER